MNKENMWHQPFDGQEFDSIFNEYSIEPKILLKNEPKHLYDVVKSIVGEIKTFSRICLVAKVKETGPKNEKITREIIINTITSEIKSTSVIPNYFLALLGNQFILLLLESTGDKILEYIQFINERMESDNSVFEQCNILSYVEDVRYKLFNYVKLDYILNSTKVLFI